MTAVICLRYSPNFMARELDPDVPFEEQKFVLESREGSEWVEKIEGLPLSTVPTHFHFTRDKKKAKFFTANDLWSRLAINPPGVQFAVGFAGGRARRVR